MTQIRKLINLGYEHYGDSRTTPYYCHCGKSGVNIILYRDDDSYGSEKTHQVILCNGCLKEFNSIKLRDSRLDKLNRILI